MIIDGVSFEVTEEEYGEVKNFFEQPDDIYIKEIRKRLFQQRGILRPSSASLGLESPLLEIKDLYDKTLLESKYAYRIHRLYKADRTQSVLFESIDLWYMFGFNLREITIQLHRLGFKVYEAFARKYLLENKPRLNEEREKMLAEFRTERELVFQNLKKEIFDTERKTLIILLEKIQTLQEELEFNTDPVNEPTKLDRLVRTIEKLESKVRKAHGIDDMRQKMVQAQAEIAVLREKHRLEKGGGDNGKSLRDATPEGHFLGFDESNTHELPNKKNSQTAVLID